MRLKNNWKQKMRKKRAKERIETKQHIVFCQIIKKKKQNKLIIQLTNVARKSNIKPVLKTFQCDPHSEKPPRLNAFFFCFLHFCSSFVYLIFIFPRFRFASVIVHWSCFLVECDEQPIACILFQEYLRSSTEWQLRCMHWCLFML